MVLVALGLASGALILSRPAPRGMVAAILCALGAALVWYVHAAVVSLVGGLVLGAGVLLASAALPPAPRVPARPPLAGPPSLPPRWRAFLGAPLRVFALWA